VLRGLLDRLVLLAGTVAGGCVPGFIQQYRQRAGGRLDQVQIDLAPFQEIARRFHGGDMDKLVQHHLASTDPSFHAEGQALQQMMDALAHLTSVVQGLSGTIWQQIGFLLRHYDRDIGAATWRDHVPTFSLDAGGILVALVIGVSLWLLFHLLWFAGRSVLAGVAARRATPPRARSAR
jgi:hypothetical protein